MENNVELQYENLLVFGGGRWARVYIDTLIKITENTQEKIFIYTPSNYNFMSNWIVERSFQNRVKLLKSIEEFKEPNSLVFVVNATEDHAKSAEWSIERHYDVIVEKPVAKYSSKLDQLIKKAKINKTILAPAHVFSFADYIKKYISFIDLAKITKIEIYWYDQISETRYGDLKKYETNIPVYLDVLPHIHSIFLEMGMIDAPICQRVEFMNGGELLKIVYRYNSLVTIINLGRNQQRRMRRIISTTEDSTMELDFAVEPGEVIVDGKTIEHSFTWAISDSPLTKMLKTIIENFTRDNLDDRLNIDRYSKYYHLIDNVANLYNGSLVNWWKNQLALGILDINHLKYSINELISIHLGKPHSINEDSISVLVQQLKQESSLIMEELDKFDDKSIIVNYLVKNTIYNIGAKN